MSARSRKNRKSPRRTRKSTSRGRRVHRFETLEDRKMMTVYVDGADLTPDGPVCGSTANPCNTIQAGVDAAAAGEQVFVESGLYTETVAIGKDIRITGAADVTVIGDAGFDGFNINGPVGGPRIDVTLENLKVTDSDIGIQASRVERLTLNNATVEFNEKDGLTLTSSGSLKVTGGKFSNNGFNGITIDTLTDGVELLDDVEADSNGLSGLDIRVASYAKIDGGSFDSNVVDGIAMDLVGDLLTDGNIEIDDVTANSNISNGIEITRSTNVLIEDSTINTNFDHGINLDEVGDVEFEENTVRFNGMDGARVRMAHHVLDTESDYSDNYDHGVEVVDAFGNVTLHRTAANNNDADLDGIGDGLHVRPEDTPAAAATLTVLGGSYSNTDPVKTQNRGVFVDGVAGTALFADSFHSVESVTADRNLAEGALLMAGTEAKFENGAFTENGSDGIKVVGYGGVDANGITATSNDANGLHVDATGTVDIENGSYDDNDANGIRLMGIGMTKLAGTSLTANRNLENGLSAMMGGELFVSDGDFDSNTMDGLDVTEVMHVSMKNISAALNGEHGADISLADVVEDDGSEFVSNDDHGMKLTDILTAVIVQNTDASFNDYDGDSIGDGIRAESSMPGMPAVGFDFVAEGVVANGQQHGIYLEKIGMVADIRNSTSRSGEASANEKHGLYVGGSEVLAIDGGMFLSNLESGIVAESISMDTFLMDVEASENGSSGVSINDSGQVISGSSLFYGNGDAGLFASTIAGFSDDGSTYDANVRDGLRMADVAGDVFLGNVTATGNDRNNDDFGDGVRIYATGFADALGGDLRVESSEFYGDAMHHQENGIYVDSNSGAVFLIDSRSYDNDKDGIDIEDGGSESPFSHHDLTGSFAAVIRGGYYNDNGDEGIRLRETTGHVWLGPNPLNLTAPQLTASYNQTDGIEIDVVGLVTAIDVEANFNQLDGLNVTDAGDVTIVGGDYSNNIENGIDIYIVNDVSIGDTTVDDTGSVLLPTTAGIKVHTADAVTLDHVSVTNSTHLGTTLTAVPEVTYRTSSGEVEDDVNVSDTTLSHVRSGVALDDVTYSGVTTLNVEMGGSNDTITVQLGAALPTVSLTGGEQAFADTMIVLRESPGDTITTTAEMVTDGTSVVNYSEIERVVVDEGDLDLNGSIDASDIDGLVDTLADGEFNPQFDVNGDNAVDDDDLTAWLSVAGEANIGGAYLLGDANLDGVVDMADLHLWNANKFSDTGAWSLGDFNADGTTDELDFDIWTANRFTSSDTSGTPDPVVHSGTNATLSPTNMEDESAKKDRTRVIDTIFAVL